MTKKIILIFGIILILFVVLKYGKSIYTTILSKIKAKETIDTRIEQIEGRVWNRLKNNLNLAGYSKNYPDEIILVAFKEERLLQVYAKDRRGIRKIKEYPFTASSGKLGPKLKEGDKQIPEGIYNVEYLNPNSSYYLSIKVSYPNEFDKSKTQLKNIKDLGGDIFLHGKAVSIGCIAIGDKAIEEVFILTQKAFKNSIKVIISPRDFRTNPIYPQISDINWEDELYDKIKDELNLIPVL